MASKIAISNRALSKLGADRIISLDDDVKASRAIKNAWDVVRDAELRAHNWHFSIERAEVAALADEPVWGYAYKYALPSDCLKLLEIYGAIVHANLHDYRTVDSLPYRLEGGNILTNLEAPLQIRYIKRVTDTELFDVSFVEALACRLAAEVAEELTESGSKVEMAWKLYERAIIEAIRANALEAPNEWPLDDSWVAGRQ